MSHIFDRIVNFTHLSSAIKGMLAEDMQEMRTINLESENEELNLNVLLDQSKTKRKKKYSVREISGWNIFDWELELQLAPEFEDVREKIQDCQTLLRKVPRDRYEEKLEESALEVQQKALEIMKKKTANTTSYFFKALDDQKHNLAKDKNKIPGLEIQVEEIGIKENALALVFQLKGILNKITSSKLSPLMEDLLDITQPFLIVELREVEWIEKPALPFIKNLQDKLREFQGALALVLVDGDFRKKIRDFGPELGEALFLDRGGAVGYFRETS